MPGPIHYGTALSGMRNITLKIISGINVCINHITMKGKLHGLSKCHEQFIFTLLLCTYKQSVITSNFNLVGKVTRKRPRPSP